MAKAISRTKKGKRKLIITSSIISLILVVAIVATVFVIPQSFASDSGKVVKGVSFNGQDLSGLEQDKVKSLIQAKSENYLATPLKLTCLDSSWEVSPFDLGISLDVDTMVEDAFKVGQNKSFWGNWQEQRKIKKEGFELEAVILLNEDTFKNKVAALTTDLITAPQNATIKVNSGGKIEIVSGQTGKEIDIDKAIKEVTKLFNSDYSSKTLELSLIEVQPEITADTIKGYGIETLLGTYSTNFNAGVTDRAFNIRIAASAFQDLMIAPKEEVSFNEVVGPRSSEAGYKNAKVIVNNELVDGLGGGVCQVSSTLYNAVLMADLEIVSRRNHSLPVSYVASGRDATVSYGDIDFVFKNNTDKYIYFTSVVDGGTITINVYGNSAYKKGVKIDSAITQTYSHGVQEKSDSTLEEGTRIVQTAGTNGYKVEGTITVTDANGNVTEKALLPSIYSSKDSVVLVGTKPKPQPIAEDAPKTDTSTQSSQGISSETQNNTSEETNNSGAIVPGN